MNGLTSDCIAIDTNIFEHLLNPKHNTKNHISKLFEKLMDDEIALLMDDKKRITAEYSNKIEKILDKKDVEIKGEIRVLGTVYSYFMDNKEIVPVDFLDPLMTAITKIIPANKGADRFFVYVAFKKGRILITNDRKDMIDEGNQAGKRRQKLLQKTKKYRLKEANILTSATAYEKLNMANGA